MNHLSDSIRELNIVDSMHRTLTRRRNAAGYTLYASNWWSRLTVALIILTSCALMEVRSAASQDVPSATIEFSGGSVAAGVGYTWGKGILTFEGKHYPLKVDGLSAAHVGISHYTASGTVYNSTQVSDINGVYAAVSAG